MMKKRMKKMTALVIGAIMSLSAAMMAAGAGSTPAANVNVENARQTALAAAGLSEDQVVFTKAGSEVDEYGQEVFEIVFLVPGQLKYEFDIDAGTGAIIQSETDLWDAEYGYEYEAQINNKGMTVQPSGAEITGYQALSITAADAGFQMKDITVAKGGKSVNDGMMVYEMAFQGPDGKDYSYTVSSIDGCVLDKA